MKYAWTGVLLFLLCVLQGQLWSGRGSIQQVQEMRAMLAHQQNLNRKSSVVNDGLREEIRDLKEGLEVLEETARHELGMVKPDEVFVQIVPL